MPDLLMTLKATARRVTLALFQHVYELFAPREVCISPLYTTASPMRSRIPNSIYQTWKKQTLPSFHARYVQRFRALNSDYSFFFFNDKAMAEYMDSHYAGHPILSVFRDLRIPAAKADIWRYCILYLEGGIYCDIDSALSVPFRQILQDDWTELLSFENNKWRNHLDLGHYADASIFLAQPPDSIKSNLDYQDNVILNWLLCFEKGSPILEEVINLIVRHFNFFRNKNFENMWKAVIHCTGPLALTQAVWMWMDRTGKSPRQFGIDFGGHGIFKLPGSGRRYATSPHFRSLSNSSITQS